MASYLWRSVCGVASRHPLVFGASMASCKTGGSDYLTQRFLEGKEEIDKPRNLVFVTWGLLYLGGVQYFLYNKVLPQYLFPNAVAFVAKPLRAKLADRRGQAMALTQVFLDQFVHHPLVFFPAFYQLKEFIEGGTPEVGFAKYKKNIGEDLLTLWSIWVPAQLFNMSFCPLWARIPFVSFLSAGYTCLVSSMRGGKEVMEEETEQSGEVTLSVAVA